MFQLTVQCLKASKIPTFIFIRKSVAFTKFLGQVCKFIYKVKKYLYVREIVLFDIIIVNANFNKKVIENHNTILGLTKNAYISYFAC